MTTGSISFDAFTPFPATGGWTGTKGGNSWTGADQNPPRSRSRVKYPKVYVYRRFWNEEGKLRAYRVLNPAYIAARDAAMANPPKRAKYDEHAFYRHVARQRDEIVKPTVPHNYPGGFPVMQFHVVAANGLESLIDANDQIKLVNKLRDLLYGGDFNFSVFMGEANQTVGLIADTATRVAKGVFYARKGDFGGAIRSVFSGTSRSPLKKPRTWADTPLSPKQQASNWLELQYGWIPLLQDAAGAAEFLAHQLEVPFRQTYRCSVRREKLVTRVSYGSYNNTYPIDCETFKVHRRSLIAKISEEPSLIAKLGLLDPELVAWELVPFSFVADWFIPIGSWMQARAFAQRLKGTFITTDKRSAYTYPPKPRNPAIWDRVPTATYQYMDINRAISSTLSVPMPKSKGLAKAASWQHCANAVALVTTMFSSGLKG